MSLVSAVVLNALTSLKLAPGTRRSCLEALETVSAAELPPASRPIPLAYKPLQTSTSNQLEFEELGKWFARTGLPLTAEQGQRINRLDSPQFARLLFPTWGPDLHCQVSRLFAVAVLLDDDLIETSLCPACTWLSQPLDRLVRVVAGDEPAWSGAVLGAYAKAFAEIFDNFQALEPRMDDPWRRKFAARFDEYIRSGLLEAQQANLAGPCAQGHNPTAVTAGHPRLANFVATSSRPANDLASAASLLLTRFQLRASTLFVRFLASLDPAQAPLERWDEQVDAAATAALIVNDFYGMGRDVRRDELRFNYVLEMASLLGLSTLQETVELALEIHDQCLQVVRKEAAWLDSLVSGYALWHDAAPRYKEYFTVSASLASPLVFEMLGQTPLKPRRLQTKQLTNKETSS